MATDLDDRPHTDSGSDASNPGQKHYDDVFNELTSKEHLDKDGESRGGSYKPKGGDSETSDTSAPGKKSGRLDKAKGLYNSGKDVKQRVSSRVGGLLKKKWLLALGAGGGGLAMLLLLLLLLLSSLKIPHLAENISAYQFARVTQQMSRNSTRILSEKISIASAKQAVYKSLEQRFGASTTKVRDTWSKLDRFRPNKIINNFNETGTAQFEYKTIGSRQFLAGIRLGDTSFPVQNIGFKKGLIPLYKFGKNIKFASDVAPRLNSALKADSVGPIIRGRVAKQIRQELGISLIAWKVGEFKGKSAEQARLLEERNANKAISGDSKETIKTEPIKNAAKDAAEAEEKAIADDGQLKATINDGGRIKAVRDSITKSFKESKFQTALGFANTTYAVATPICIVYEGSLTQAQPSIDQQMAAQQKAYYFTASHADQQKDGTDGSAEATGAFNEKLGDISNSLPMLRANGQAAPTSGYTSAEAGAAGGSYTIADALLGGHAATFTNWFADKFCPIFTNTKVAIAVAAINIGTLFIPGIGQASKGAQEAAKKEATSVVGKFAQKIADRIIRKRGTDTLASKSLNVSSKVSDVVTAGVKSGAKIAAATVLAKMIVMAKAGYTNNGLEQNNDFVAMADAGGNIAGNEVSRKGLYGRPLTKGEADVAAQQSVAFVNEQNSQKSSYQRYLALSNPQSLLTKFGMATASSLSSVKIPSLLKNLGNLLDPTALLSGILSHVNPASVHAAAARNASSLNYGNIQFGFSSNEQALMANDSSYGPLENQDRLDKSEKEDEIASKYGDCFTKSLGTLLSEEKIKTDDEGNVKASGGLCAPDNLSYNNSDYGDLVFRWRVAHSYDMTIDQLEEAQDVTAGASSTNPGLTFTAGSYNIHHSVSFPDELCNATSEPKVPATTDYPKGLRPACVERLSTQQANIISGSAGNRAIDIVGLQEVSQPQQASLVSKLTNYDMYPAKVPQFHGVAVMWNKSKFSQIGKGTLHTINNVAQPADIPWVELKSNEKTFYVISVHAPNGGHNGNSAVRKAMATTIRKWAKSKESSTSTVLVMGDFNEQLGGPNNMCATLTKNSVLQNTVDMASGKAPSIVCPSMGKLLGIDHVYASPSPSLSAQDWAHLSDSRNLVKTASDHSPTLVTLKFENAGSSLRIATYNVKGATHSGGVYKARADKVIQNIGTTYHIDVAGMQEFQKVQRDYIMQHLPDYDNFPKGSNNKGHRIEDSIIWNKTKYKLADDTPNSGFQPNLQYFCGPPGALDAPWVKLQDISTGQQFYVLNTHDPANSNNNDCNSEAPARRLHNAKEHVAFIKTLQADQLPIFYTGDFNSGYDVVGNNRPLDNKAENLTYCVMVGSGVVNDAYDLYKGRPFKCPNPKPRSERGGDSNGIDHVFASPGVKVTKWTRVLGPAAGSDHPIQIFDAIIPGSTGSTSAPKQRPPEAKVTKVLTIVEENHSLSQMKANMPYTFSLAQEYGYATGYKAITHPSLPNYIAIAGGSTYGINSDKLPSAYNVNGTSVFAQALSHGKTSKVYAESMTTNCDASAGGAGDLYRTKHNPWTYFKKERTQCKKFDVPYSKFSGDVASGQLPNLGMVIPNMCHDAHNCDLSAADSWFKSTMAAVLSGPDWKSGHLAIILTADEDDRSAAGGNDVLTVVIHPSLYSKVVSTKLTHYSLSGLYSQVAGAAPLKNAGSAPSLATAFGLSL